MFHDKLSDYFEGVAAKYLSAVDAEPSRSNQHEIGGLPSVGFKKFLGTPQKDEKKSFRARMVYIADADEAPEICNDVVTWYDSRWKDPDRSPEYRLYYKTNPITACISEGDFFLIGKLHDNSLLLVFTRPGSTVEFQLRYLFGIGGIDHRFQAGRVDSAKLLLPLRNLLEDLGVAISYKEDTDEYLLEKMIHRFGGTGFPDTASFSSFSMQLVGKNANPVEDPDGTLILWMDHEERLFRIFEKHLVKRQLIDGFGTDGNEVDRFIDFSLGVQNRRKSRVGHAFERYLGLVFSEHHLKFERGRAKHGVTENNSKPDFIFPDFLAYHDPYFPSNKLCLLGAKTTCKDRWRQVLSEGARIQRKHLVTMEPAISEAQTNEMRSHNLQLVVPTAVRETYSSIQQSWILSISDFINEVRKTQKSD